MTSFVLHGVDLAAELARLRSSLAPSALDQVGLMLGPMPRRTLAQYDAPSRCITIDPMRHASDGAVIATLAHEVAHALSDASVSASSSRPRRLRETEHGRAWRESFRHVIRAAYGFDPGACDVLGWCPYDTDLETQIASVGYVALVWFVEAR